MRHRLREDERSLLAASSFIVIPGAATLIATHFSYFRCQMTGL